VRRWLSLNEASPPDIPRAIEILLELLTPAKVKRLTAELEAER
jgi:hypothetical protein